MADPGGNRLSVREAVDVVIDYRTDSRFKKYQSAIEKSLQTFESVGEWADIISFLNRLSKVYRYFAIVI